MICDPKKECGQYLNGNFYFLVQTKVLQQYFIFRLASQTKKYVLIFLIPKSKVSLYLVLEGAVIAI